MAVLVILLFHLDVASFSGGFVGVDIFFVISGYLITKIITEQISQGSFDIGAFYARRVRRILPALFVMLGVTSAFAIVILGAESYADFFRALRYASFQISNLYYSREVDYFAHGNELSPLLHTWSLGVEEQFYLLWPFLLMASFRLRGEKAWPVALLAVFIASLGVSEFLARHDSLQGFYWLHSRAWQLTLGGLVATVRFPHISSRRGRDALSVAGIAMMILPAIYYHPENVPGLKALIPCLGCAILLQTAQAGTAAGHKLLSLKPLRAAGLVSYSLYLWHWPIVAFYKYYMSPELTLPVQIGIGAASFAMAFISYVLIEQPGRKMRLSNAASLIVFALIAASFLLLANFIKKEKYADWRVTYKMDRLEREPHDLDRICSTEGGTERGECTIGPNKDDYEVILAGDSHASHYVPMVRAWAEREGLTVRLFTRSACATWLESDAMPMRNGRPYKDCKQLSKKFYDTLEKDKSIRLVILGKNMPEDNEHVRRSLAKIKSTGADIVMLGSIPRFRQNPHDCLIRQHVLLSRWIKPGGREADCTTPDPEFYKRELRALPGFKELLSKNKIPYFDPIPFFSSGYDENGRLMFLDEAHINRYGSAHMIPAFEKFMDEQEPAEGWGR